MAKLKARISMSLEVNAHERRVLAEALLGDPANQPDTMLRRKLHQQFIDMETLESNFRQSIVRVNHPMPQEDSSELLPDFKDIRPPTKY